MSYAPLVQVLAPRTVRDVATSATLGKTLNPGVPVHPLATASLDDVGQRLVCYAGASPTEDSCWPGRRIQRKRRPTATSLTYSVGGYTMSREKANLWHIFSETRKN